MRRALAWIALPSLIAGCIAGWLHWTENAAWQLCYLEGVPLGPPCNGQWGIELEDVVCGLAWSGMTYLALVLVAVIWRQAATR